MGIGCTHNRSLQQTVVLIHTHQGFHDEHYKSEVILRSFACRMKQNTSISAEAPVVVLTRTVDACEWLLVKEHAETVLMGHTLHQTHQEHVMVNGKIALLEDRRQLKLVRSHLIMAGLTRNTEFESLYFQIFHECLHALRNSSEIVVVHLLVLRRVVSHQRTSGKHQVRAGRIETFIHEEIFLFPSQVGLHLLHLRIEVMTHFGSCLTQCMERAEQWSLIIEGLTCIRNKNGRDTERIIDDKDWRSWVPGRITSGLESVADSAIRERTGIRLLLNKQLA